MQQVAYAEFRFIFVLRERKPDGRKRHIQKHKYLFLLWMYTNKSNPFTIPIIVMTKRVVASTVRMKKMKNQAIAPALHARTQLSILPWQCSLFIIIIQKQSVKHMEKTHCSV